MLKNLIKLLVSLSLISSAYAETTNNLVSQDFTTGWSGTNLSSKHGSNTIAGVHGQYILSDSVSLNDNGINKESLNEGFTVTGSANYYFWSGAQQSVTQTIKTVDDNGNTITQIRVVSGTSGSGTTYDQLVIGSNSQQDYNVSLRYDFSIPQYPNYHYAADLSNPSLTVSYTYVPPMDAATQAELFAINETIKEDLKDVQSVEIKEEAITLKTDTLQTEKIESAELTTTSTDTMSTDSTKDLTSAEPPKETQSYQDSSSTTSDSQQSAPQESVSSAEAAPSESQKSDQASAETSDDKQEATSESGTSQDVVGKDDKQTSDSKISSLNNSIDNIDVKVKDPGKNLELKNLVMMEKMVDNSMLKTYANIPFYRFKAIYEDQINIRDNRILYPNASLVSYTQNDPVFQKENMLYNIRLQKQKLLKELEVLKSAG